MLQIGNIKLALPVVQAALSGYSDWPMRAMARRLGAPYSVAEVMIDNFVNSLRDRKRTQHFLMVTDDDHPVGAQLMGADPDGFTTAARRLADSGFDVIDINFGCPVKKVLGRCRGGFHLGQPEVAEQILRNVRSAVPDHIPVTLKMRRGIDDSHESRDHFFRILSTAFAEGISAATVHGRTVMQRYNGPSRWEFLREVRREFPSRTILGSGDLFTAEDCVRMIRQTGVDGVTAARGSIGNPWIYAQARELLEGRPLPAAPTIFEQRDVLVEHFRLAESVYAANRAAKQLRKFGMRYADWHPRGDEVRGDFIRCSNAEMWHSVIAKWYAEDGPGCYPSNPGIPKPPATAAADASAELNVSPRAGSGPN